MKLGSTLLVASSLFFHTLDARPQYSVNDAHYIKPWTGYENDYVQDTSRLNSRLLEPAVQSSRRYQPLSATDLGRYRDHPLPVARKVQAVTSVNTAAARCGLPACGGEASWYRFSPGDIFYCDKAVGRNLSTRKHRIVALPGYKELNNRSLCGSTIRLRWNGRETTAKIADKCPKQSCVRSSSIPRVEGSS